MCNMHRLERAYLPLDQGMHVIESLNEQKFMIVYFTGGEPSLHPNLIPFVRRANELGLVTSTTTNGTSPLATLMQLHDAGLDVLSVSLDHWDSEVCERLRGHRGIQASQEAKIRYAKKIGLRTYALAYLNAMLCRHGAIETFVEYVEETLDVPVAFCFPTESEENSYRLCGLNSDADYSKLYLTVQRILELKHDGHHILNPTVYLEDVLRFLSGTRPAVYCRGGEDVIYVDWEGNAYPCFLRPKLFNMRDEKPRLLHHVRCNDCVINCFREPSIFAQFPKGSVFALREYSMLSFLFGQDRRSSAP